MKFASIPPLALVLGLTIAQKTFLDVTQVLTAYAPGITGLKPEVSTALASAINSVASTWYESPQLTSLDSAILAAAPSKSSESFASSGIPYGLVYTESWYTKSVPAALQSVLSAQFSALDSAQSRVLGTQTTNGAAATSTTSGNVAMRTGAPVAIMGVAGMVGGIMAVL